MAGEWSEGGGIYAGTKELYKCRSFFLKTCLRKDMYIKNNID